MEGALAEGAIPENADGEDESDDDNLILSKVERRRLNQLSNRGDAVGQTVGVTTANRVAE